MYFSDFWLSCNSRDFGIVSRGLACPNHHGATTFYTREGTQHDANLVEVWAFFSRTLSEVPLNIFNKETTIAYCIYKRLNLGTYARKGSAKFHGHRLSSLVRETVRRDSHEIFFPTLPHKMGFSWPSFTKKLLAMDLSLLYRLPLLSLF